MPLYEAAEQPHPRLMTQEGAAAAWLVGGTHPRHATEKKLYGVTHLTHLCPAALLR